MAYEVHVFESETLVTGHQILFCPICKYRIQFDPEGRRKVLDEGTGVPDPLHPVQHQWFGGITPAFSVTVEKGA